MTRYRLTGIGPWSVQWEKKDDDAEILRRVINLLADRRLLWQDFSLEIQEQCVESASTVRKKLGEHMDNPEIGELLADRLAVLQRHFRDFMTEVGSDDDRWRRHSSPIATDPFSEALGRLRALVGVELGGLAAYFDVPVPDQLAVIVPGGGGWFWELLGD
jgi:hypothetical protein